MSTTQVNADPQTSDQSDAVRATDEHVVEFSTRGFTVVRGLFSADEAAAYRDHFMELNAAGNHDGDFAGVEGGGEFDPLKKYPRMIHMHRWDETSLGYLLHPRIRQAMFTLLGRDPYAVQTMLYFKPPGARGQAIHQDNFYLRAQPSTCVAAWMALDVCDEDNGCLKMVPGSHEWETLCTVTADTSQSFTDVTVPLPEGVEPEPVRMQPGDVLFFNGQVVHGSNPNTTEDRFRRSLIGHYIQGDAEKVAKFYNPALTMDGKPLELEIAEGGGSCGVWVDQDGKQVIEVVGEEGLVLDHE
ncbi:phytanoyl-CoA dioxygenase family protein [Aestuariimicrobium ganziense]|uniref:phytanoyl-CoA dioxygenase family protein n=1 Tax=Aestuariimicrobium ganziense TaxID=2773677 RepID=UPI002E280DD2|nr:phytanoyl-CoA dioxygenase family protein [Aestuariimicrobium ganziense]